MAEQAEIKFRVNQTRDLDPAIVGRDHVARFNELTEDPAIFDTDRSDTGAQRHFHAISGDGVLPTTTIQTPHHFHISYVELPPGHFVELHAHNVPEVFIPMTCTFELSYGDEAENSVVIVPMDTFFVPIDVMRTFKNIGLTTALIMVIYDSPGDVLEKIFYDADVAETLRETFEARGDKVVIEQVAAG
jgi:uncharacterized RmlC-like cupin family protein